MIKKSRHIIFIIILILNLQIKSIANDLTDFEIEGFTINQNLIDFFDENQINEELNSGFAVFYKNNKFADITVGETTEHPMRKDLDIYEEVGITIKPGDKTYKIYSVGGTIICKTENECHKTQKEIVTDLVNYFDSDVKLKKWEDKYINDKTRKSMVYGNEFIFPKTNDSISVNFYSLDKDYADKENYYNHYLIISISSYEFDKFLREEAYN